MGVDLSVDSIVVCAPDLVSADVDDEDVVILHVKAGRYFGLEASGADIWKMVQEPIKVGKIVDAITESFDVEADQCEADVLELLRDMVEKRLVLVKANDRD